MPHIWTTEEKTEMKRLRDGGMTNANIGLRFEVNGGIVRKVLERFTAAEQRPPATQRTTEAAPIPRPEPLDEGSEPPSSDGTDARLRAAHDAFDAKTDNKLRASRPKWAD